MRMAACTGVLQASCADALEYTALNQCMYMLATERRAQALKDLFWCRDLKTGNLLVADNGHILLADFGACAILEREAAAPRLATALQRPDDTSHHTVGSPLSATGALCKPPFLFLC